VETAARFPLLHTPTAAELLTRPLRYTNNLAGTKDRAEQDDTASQPQRRTGANQQYFLVDYSVITAADFRLDTTETGSAT
jgi:hypothetical protein